MVCPRCIMVVQDCLEKLGAESLNVSLGHARVKVPAGFLMDTAATDLKKVGFELLFDPEQQLTEQLRLKILDYLQLSEGKNLPLTLSAFLTEGLHKNYTALSKHFTRHAGQTIEGYYINCRIERVKALLNEQELNVSQIADKLGYSSVHYLSAQFKKVTGISISTYKSEGRSHKRISLDAL